MMAPEIEDAESCEDLKNKCIAPLKRCFYWLGIFKLLQPAVLKGCKFVSRLLIGLLVCLLEIEGYF